MREIELGKLLGENPQENIVKFIGCVTTQGKTLIVIIVVLGWIVKTISCLVALLHV